MDTNAPPAALPGPSPGTLSEISGMARKLKAARQLAKAEAAAARVKAEKDKAKQDIGLKKKAPGRAIKSPNSRQHAWLPFDSERPETVLLVGEGDFSFASALAQKYSALDVIATSLDTEQGVTEKYSDTAPACIASTRDAGGEIAYGIDATRLTKHRHMKSLSARGKPLKVVFNFPHLGNSVADQDRNIRQHQELLLGFFREAKALGASHVVVTLFTGEPYESWQPKQLARSAGWALDRSARFAWDEFPGYRHQLTAKGGARTNKSQQQRDARIYLWCLQK